MWTKVSNYQKHCWAKIRRMDFNNINKSLNLIGIYEPVTEDNMKDIRNVRVHIIVEYEYK